eukprot:3130125-Pyramimonas_sp.AAC.1
MERDCPFFRRAPGGSRLRTKTRSPVSYFLKDLDLGASARSSRSEKFRLDVCQSRQSSYLSVSAEGAVQQFGADERQVARLVGQVDGGARRRPTRAPLKRAET